MQEIPNIPTTLIVTESFTRGKWFIRDRFHVIEQRDSCNYIACEPDNLTQKLHLRIITTPNQIYGVNFQDYILVGRIDNYMLDALDVYSHKMKQKYNLGL